MSTVSLKKPRRIAELSPLAVGEAIIITRSERPVAQLAQFPYSFGQPVPGRFRGMLTILGPTTTSTWPIFASTCHELLLDTHALLWFAWTILNSAVPQGR